MAMQSGGLSFKYRQQRGQAKGAVISSPSSRPELDVQLQMHLDPGLYTGPHPGSAARNPPASAPGPFLALVGEKGAGSFPALA